MRLRTFGFAFSWRRAVGLSAALGWLARLIGIPTTRQGRQRKLGRWMRVRQAGFDSATRRCLDAEK